MPDEKTVFEQTCENYLSEIGKLPLAAVAERVGAAYGPDGLRIPLFDRTFSVSPAGIIGPDGRRAGYDVCVIISRLLLYDPPGQASGGTEWVSFRDFKDSRPLHNFFAHDIEQALAREYSGNIAALDTACIALGGYTSELRVSYDLVRQFDALPLIPLVLLFNDADMEFAATSSILFPARTEAFLDAECIAMLGAHLVARLRNAGRQGAAPDVRP
jgi:hypothetical protein